MKTYSGHTNVKYNAPACIIDARPDGEQSKKGSMPEAWVVAGSDTGEVFIWDLQTKEVLQKLGEHTGD